MGFMPRDVRGRKKNALSETRYFGDVIELWTGWIQGFLSV